MIINKLIVFATSRPDFAIVLAICVVVFVGLLLKRFPVLGAYFLIVVAALIISLEFGGLAYLCAFGLGMATALLPYLSVTG